MALILVLNYTDRSTLTTGVFGATDLRNVHVGADAGDTGLTVNTVIPQCLVRDASNGPVVTAALHAQRADRTDRSGSTEPTTVRLLCYPGGVDVLSDLDGKEVNGHEAQLIEVGTLNGVVYTVAAPWVWRKGVIAGWKRSADGQSVEVTIQAPGTGLSDQALDLYRGFGMGLLFADAGTAHVAWEVWDPSGDFSFSCYAMFPYEEWNTAVGILLIMGNTDVRLRWNDRTVEALITHATSGAQTITSGDIPRPERFYMLRCQYVSSTKVFELFIDGASQGTVTGVGARTTSGNTWYFGSAVGPAVPYNVGILGEFRFYDGTVTSGLLDTAEQHPLIGNETDLYAWHPGWTNIAGTALFDYANINAASPRDGTITGATPATLLGGNLREPSDSIRTETPAAAGHPKPWPLGAAVHVFCRPIDSQNKIFGVCDDQKGVADFLNVYEGGVLLTITHRVTSWLALYAVTLSVAGDCAVYPQGGGVMLHTRKSGAITADVLGGTPLVRGASFDGAGDQIDFGTGLNSLFISGFTIRLMMSSKPLDPAGEIILQNFTTGKGIFVSMANNNTAPNIQVTIADPIITLDPFIPHSYVGLTCDWVVTVSGSDVTSTLFIDGVQVATGATTGTIVAGTAALQLGNPSVDQSTFDDFEGTIGEFAIFTEAKTLAWHQRTLHANLIGTLDEDGVAIDEGGGLVSLPSRNHPQAAGESVEIAGTTNYNSASTTLHANTTDDRLWITATYNAETFDGSETVKDATLAHYYPGRTWDFDPTTLSDEGVAAAADGTITGATFNGGVAPTSPRSLVVFVAKEGGQRHARFDLTGAADWPEDPMDWSRETG